MVVWIQNPFDSLPLEGSRKMRYWLMCEAFARAGWRVLLFTSDFSHATKKRRAVEATRGTRESRETWGGEAGLAASAASGGEAGLASLATLSSPASPNFSLHFIPTRPYSRNVSFVRIASHRAYAREWLKMAEDPALPRPDLIVASMPTISGAAAALALGRRFGAKVVVDVQDAWPETFERIVPRFALWPLRRAARRIYRDSDLVTGVCSRYRDLTGRADYYLAYHGIETRSDSATDFTNCHGLKIGASAVEATRGSRESRGTWGGEAGLAASTASSGASSLASLSPLATPKSPQRLETIRLVYSGNLGRSYDLATLVAVVEADPRLTLDVAGFGAFSSSCPRIKFHGFLSESDLQSIFAACDIGVVPMAPDSWVGIPNKFADYSRAGLRIVSSLGGESSALLEKYRCGATYRVGDAASLASAIKVASSLSSAASREMCEREFDATKIYDAYVARVQELFK